jgi:hypothetical protein
MSASVPNSSDNNQEINIEIEMAVLAKALIQDPSFMALVSIMVRNMLTKDVRRMGNLFANTGGKQVNNQTILPSTELNVNQGKRLS